MWWNVNYTYSVSNLIVYAGSLTPIMLRFPHTPPDKAMLEATSFTYNPLAVSCVIFMAISQGKTREQILRGQKKNREKNPCESEQTNLAWETGLPDLRLRPLIRFTAPLQCASDQATGKKTMSRCRPQTGAVSAFLLAPLGWQPSAVWGVLSALVEDVGSFGFLPSHPSGVRVAWHQSLQECHQYRGHAFGSGCQKTAWGTGQRSAGAGLSMWLCMVLRWWWGKAGEFGWTRPGVRLGDRKMEQVDRDMLHPEVWPETDPWSLLFKVSAIFWYLLLSVVALKLTLGTSGLGGHSHPGDPEARPWSSLVMSVHFRSGCGQRLGWTEQKRKVSYFFCSWQQLLCFLKQMNPVCVSLCCLDGRSPWLLAEPGGEAGSRLISQSIGAVAHHCCHFWWLIECQGCNDWNNYLQKVCLCGSV